MGISTKAIATNIFYRIRKKDMNPKDQNNYRSDDLKHHFVRTNKIDHKSKAKSGNDRINGIRQWPLPFRIKDLPCDFYSPFAG